MKINKRTIVDVRTAEAFAAGHPSGSINIPLEQLEERTGEIRNLPGPVILCSGTGNRSAKAETLLKAVLYSASMEEVGVTFTCSSKRVVDVKS